MAEVVSLLFRDNLLYREFDTIISEIFSEIFMINADFLVTRNSKQEMPSAQVSRFRECLKQHNLDYDFSDEELAQLACDVFNRRLKRGV